MKRGLRNIIAMTLATFTVGSFLTACGNDNLKSGNSSDGNVILTYSIWDKGQEPAMRAIADAFEKENPNIKINVEITPWDQYWMKMDAAAQGGALPDIFWMHSSQISRYGRNRKLLDLTDRIKNSKKINLNNYPEGLVELYSPDNKNYAIPKDYDTTALWYNKALFDEAGIPYPDETWTWDTLLETAKKLTNKENKIYGFGAPLNSHEGYYNFIFQNGGYILSDDKKKCGYDDKKTLEALRCYIDLGLKEGVSPTQKEFEEVSPLTLFESGKLAMGIFGSWNVANFKQNEYVRENCDIAGLPMGEKRASVYNGLGNAIGYNTKHPEEAWKFVEFLGGKEANILQAEYGAAIPAYKGIDEKWVEVTKEFNARAHVEMLDYAEILPYSNRTARWKVIEDDLWPRVWAGQANLDEVSKRMDKDIEEVLAED